MLDVIIDDKHYEFISSIHYNNKTYVALSLDNDVYINEYIIDSNNNISLIEIKNEELDIIKEKLGL